MAITSGAGPHYAWLNTNGGTFPIEHGAVEQQAARKSSTFSAAIPLNYPGAEAAIANLGDNTTTISVQTRGITATLITGEIDTTSFDYIGTTIRVSGRDKSAKLHEQVSSEKWINKKGSEIVQDLAGRVGLSVDAETSKLLAGKLLQQDYVKLSDGVTFAHIIHKLAEFDGARWWVDPQGTMHYVISGSPNGVYTLNYSRSQPITSDCLRLNISRNVQAGKTINVSISSWHPKDKRVYSNVATVGGNGGPLKYTYDLPTLKQDHVEQHSKSRANEIARNEITIHASVAGDPSCNAGMGLQLNGTGFWDQMYEIDCVQHEIGMSGHRTSITARAGKGGRSAS